MSESLSDWLHRLSEGDQDAARELWAEYFEKLVRLARRKLEGVSLRSVDEEDVALSAMDSFCRGMAQRKFEEISDSDELWKLLVTITARKICAKRRLHFAQKRGSGKVRGESVFLAGSDSHSFPDLGIGEVLGKEPTPDFASEVAENSRNLIDLLQDETLEKIVLLTLEGYKIPEIAQKMGCVRRTVERKLQLVREIWKNRGFQEELS